MLRLLAILTVQWHLMGRIDDIMKLAISTIVFNSCNPFTLHIKMCWSKNIRNERQSPTQIMFASMDPIICPLLNLVTMIEVVGTDGDFLFGRSNKSAAQQLKLVYSSDFFKSQRTGEIGTHSVRKGSATFASRSGCHKDWINQRGRWRGAKQQVDTYIDSYQPYPDARVASVLCGPRGPCKYVVKDEVMMPAEFLESITPHSHDIFGSDIAEVLALPLLWAAYERESPCNGVAQTIIPSRLADLIRERWVAAGGLVDVNPIEKIKLAVEQNADQLILIPLITNGVEEGTHQEGPCALQQRVEDMRNDLTGIFAEHRRFMSTINTNVRRIVVRPVVQGRINDTSASGASRVRVKLSKSPRDLWTLWMEYESGLNGQKPARDFTAVERGANKFTYSRRKVVWDAVEKLMKRGNAADVAIDQILAVYGRDKSVTNVINRMKKDKLQGIWRL
jgi:hypothetical protein